MKAWQVTRPGQPGDALELTDVPRPEPAAGQLLVRVLAAAANFPDYLLCLGTYQEELTRLVAACQIKSLITERLPLSDVPSAIGRLGAGATTGRLVFQP